MAHLNVKGLTPAEAQRIRRAARSRGETMRDFMLRSGRLRAELEAGAASVLREGLAVPACVVVLGGGAPSVADYEEHNRYCPICAAEQVQRHVGPHAAPGWADLAREAPPFEGLQARVAALPPRERDIVTDLYGLDGRQRQSMADVGRRFGLSRERVRQLADRAVASLRAAGPGSPRAPARRG